MLNLSSGSNTSIAVDKLYDSNDLHVSISLVKIGEQYIDELKWVLWTSFKFNKPLLYVCSFLISFSHELPHHSFLYQADPHPDVAKFQGQNVPDSQNLSSRSSHSTRQ